MFKLANISPTSTGHQQISNHEHVDREDETRRIEDKGNKRTISDMYRDHSGKFLQLLLEFKDMWDGPHAGIKTARYRIEQTTKKIRPVHSALYHVDPTAGQFAEKEIHKMLREAVIGLSNTEWARSFVFVRKKDGSLRCYVNYRKLNKMIVRESDPLQRIGECIDFLGEVRILLTLHEKSGYRQIGIDELDRSKSAFTSHHGVFRFG